MVEKRRHRSDRCRLIPVSAVYTRGERLHKIRDRPLCQRKQDTAGHLAAEFHVSLRTIYYDLEYLSLIYPLEVIRGRYHGGIKIADYFTPDKTKLTPVQRDLLLRLFTNLYGNDKLIMLSILDTFT